MPEASSSATATATEPGSLVQLIRDADFPLSRDVEQLQAFAAPVQQHRLDIGASPHTETTRSTALWSAMQLDPEIRTGLEQAGTSADKLAAELTLATNSVTGHRRRLGYSRTSRPRCATTSTSARPRVRWACPRSSSRCFAPPK